MIDSFQCIYDIENTPIVKNHHQKICDGVLCNPSDHFVKCPFNSCCPFYKCPFIHNGSTRYLMSISCFKDLLSCQFESYENPFHHMAWKISHFINLCKTRFMILYTLNDNVVFTNDKKIIDTVLYALIIDMSKFKN